VAAPRGHCHPPINHFSIVIGPDVILFLTFERIVE